MTKVLSTLVAVSFVVSAFVFTEKSESKVEVAITEWQVPWEQSRPRDPYVAPDGDVWFVGQRSHYVAEFDPDSEEFRKFDLEDGAGPHTVIVSQDGTPWYAGNRANHIGRINPESGEITKFMMPEDNSARDPHTMAFNQEGDIWFTSQGANSVGKLDVETGEPQIIPVPTPRARPYGLIMDHDRQRPWICLFGTNKLATVDPSTMELREIALPEENARPRRLAQTSDGMIWYGDYARGYIGRYNPGDGSFEEWKMPSGEQSRPYAVTVDDQDRIWLVETGVSPNIFVGFDTNSKTFVGSTPIESGGGTVRHMVFHKPTNAVWFGTDTNYLGRAQIQ
ncbi:Vgb family protein [Fodinibius sediminis]|uniref:Virginiamycin B lyase n=1 Tax=Fodinibius sediminis TaxID=1214077 RepID=A0A521BKF7_9BACT|nr:lyase [Fodinibius sediminis]SMO47140.1 virginiamycin B lyase [Fodinibius sediminis]